MSARRARALVMSMALLLAGGVAAAQAPLTEHTLAYNDSLGGPPASIDDLAWLVGTWEGDGLGGANDEVWLPAADGAMVGIYRLVVDGVPVLYEFLAIREDEGTLVLDLKHFGPDLVGWEADDETVTFPLVSMTENAAYFGGLTYARDGSGGLRIWLAMRGSDGTVREEAFALTRQGGP